MADGANEQVFLAKAITWRAMTNLHRSLGARSISGPLNIVNGGAGGNQTLFNGAFGSRTIDRIIGVCLRLGGVSGPGTILLTDINSGCVYPLYSAGQFKNSWFNIETNVANAEIILSSSFDITPAMNAGYSLYNFEVPPGAV